MTNDRRNSEDNFKEAKVVENKNFQLNLQSILQSANPQSVLTLTEPKILPAPLFAEFRRAAVIKTAAPVNQIQLENAVAQAVRSRVIISTADINLTWKNRRRKWINLARVNLPMLGWEICYAQRGENFIVSNSSNLLREILASPEDMPVEKVSESPIDN